jgi:hypothetical protein
MKILSSLSNHSINLKMKKRESTEVIEEVEVEEDTEAEVATLVPISLI